MEFKIILFLSILVLCEALYEGDYCNMDGKTGTCASLFKCNTALADLGRGKNPQSCGFVGAQPIVCCLDNVVATLKPVSTTSRPTTTTYDYDTEEEESEETEIIDNRISGECEPIDPKMTSPKTGQKAFDKCIEYQEKYIFPCGKGVGLSMGAAKMVRTIQCHHSGEQLIIGGNDTTKYEFPHMVMLGYGDDVSSIQWLCGGSIISERYILTAGHCISTRDIGEVKYILVGAHTRSDANKTENIYKVKSIIRHPEYRPPSKYNDIALLETETPIKLSHYLVPACLHVGDPVADDKVLATGWGLTTYGGSTSEILQKVILNKFSAEKCSNTFEPHRLMRRGYDEQSQSCYGDKSESRDTCQGDSGGPIQIKSKKLHCMYVIVGVTSFGRGCGFVGEPAIYTRVSNYVEWIENIVWH